jgi:hypothetical protein
LRGVEKGIEVAVARFEATAGQEMGEGRKSKIRQRHIRECLAFL